MAKNIVDTHLVEVIADQVEELASDMAINTYEVVRLVQFELRRRGYHGRLGQGSRHQLVEGAAEWAHEAIEETWQEEFAAQVGDRMVNEPFEALQTEYMEGQDIFELEVIGALIGLWRKS